MIKCLPSLYAVDLSWNLSITDETIQLLFTVCSNIQCVKIAGLKRITSKAFLPLISQRERWNKIRQTIFKRLQLQLGANCRKRLKDLSKYEVSTTL